MMTRTCGLAAAGALGLALAPSGAGAVAVANGTIEVAGDRATVDLFYFTVTDAGLEDIGVSPRCFSLCDVITLERSGMAIYADAGGLPGAFIAGDPGDAATPFSGLTDLPLAVGDYILAVSAFELVAGEFPPFQTDPNAAATISFDYEAGFSPGNLNFTCVLEGNLDGTVDVTRFAGDASCRVPTGVSAPPAAWALALSGLIPLARLRKRGR